MIMKNKNFISLLIIITLLSGLFWGIKYSHPYPVGEGIRSVKIADLILEEGIFTDGELMNHNIDRPMHPVFYAFLFKIFGHNYLVIRIAYLLFFIGIVLLVYKIGQMVFNERVARLAGLMTALCYTLASFTGWFYREVFFCFLVTLLIYSLYKAQLLDKKRWYMISGIVLAISILTNAMLGFFPLFILGYFLLLARGNKKFYLKIAVFFLAFSLIIIPWVISCYLNFGRFFFTAGSGLILPQRVERMKTIEDKYIQHLVGNSLGDFFAYRWYPDYNPSDSRFGWDNWLKWQNMVHVEKIDRAEVDKIMTKGAIEEIFKNPWLYTKLVFIDLLKLNTPMTPDTRMQAMFVKTHQNVPDWLKAVIILSIRFIYLILAGMIFYGVIKNLKKWKKIGWLVLIVLYFNFILSNLIAIARYSVPIYPFYILLSSVGIIIFWTKLKKKLL